MRLHFVLIAMLTTSCAATPSERVGDMPIAEAFPKATTINLETYSHPFGYAPEQADLGEVLLSLPNALAADMSVRLRKRYIADYGSKSFGYLFDSKHGSATFYSDNPYEPRPSCRFYYKLFPSTKFRYVLAIHLQKPSTSGSQNPPPPTPANTFVLAPVGSQWVDVTDQVLPKTIHRDWYFQPERIHNRIETGPYTQDITGSWRADQRIYDLVWHHDRFSIRTPSSTDFSYDGF